MQLDLLALRLEAIHRTQTRTKVALWTLILLSGAIFILNYNAYVSWYRDFLADDLFSDIENSVVTFARKKLIEEYISTRSFQVPLIGVKVLVSDACMLAGVAFLIGSTWLYFCQRRENHSTASLLADTHFCDRTIRSTVYHSVLTGMVLSVISDNDQPIYDYRAPRSDHINQVARFWSRAFIYLPAVALAVIFAADLLTFYCQSSPFRYEHAIPADDVLRDAGVKLWRTSAATFLCFTLVVYISQLADRFDDATLACLRIYFPEAQEDALVGLVVHNEETSDGGGAT